MNYLLKFGSNEDISKTLLSLWLQFHPTNAEKLNYETYGETAGRHADIECYWQYFDVNGDPYWSLVWVAEVKIDSDAESSFNSGHMYNNFAQLRDDYPDVPKYLFLVNTHKKVRKYTPSGKFYMAEAFSQDLIARCFSLGQIVGKAICYYMSDTLSDDVKDKDKHYFGDRVWKLCEKPIKEVDCGIRYLEREKASDFEMSLQAFHGMNPFHAAKVLSECEYRNWKELIWAGTGYDRETGKFWWDPDAIELDPIWPPNKDNSENQRRINFLEAVGGKK